MYYDLPESGVGGDHLSDLFDVNEVFDRFKTYSGAEDDGVR